MLLNLPNSGKGVITQASFHAQPSVFMQVFVLCNVKKEHMVFGVFVNNLILYFSLARLTGRKISVLNMI